MVAGGGGFVQVAVGICGVVVVSCHPLPTSNVPVTIGLGGTTNNSFHCNGSDTVFVQQHLSLLKVVEVWWFKLWAHRGKDGEIGGGGGDDGSAVPGAAVTTNHGSSRAGFAGGKKRPRHRRWQWWCSMCLGGKREEAGFGRTLVPLEFQSVSVKKDSLVAVVLVGIIIMVNALV